MERRPRCRGSVLRDAAGERSCLMCGRNPYARDPQLAAPDEKYFRGEISLRQSLRARRQGSKKGV